MTYNWEADAKASWRLAVDKQREELLMQLPGVKRARRIGQQDLLLGDNTEILPHLPPVDACVTDPPYGIGAAKMQLGNGKKNYEKGKDWDDLPADLAALPDVPKIIWGGNYFHLPPTRAPLVWDKKHGNGVDFADFEMAWTNLDMVARRIAFRPMNMDGGKQHPTQKPVVVMEWCLGFLPNATTILDPFMGSGTTLVACQKLGRSGIGIEIDPDYWSIACERVHKAWMEPDLFIDAKPTAPVQERLFDE